MASPNAVDDEQQNKRQRLSDDNKVPVRTLFIRRIPSILTREVCGDFAKFGEIELVTIKSKDPTTHWCLVQFKRAEDVQEALLRTRNEWNDYDVKAANPWHQPDHPLHVGVPEQDSDSNILVALNDDCLLEIFKRLKLMDLTNVAGVCKRFNEQAKIVFALKHKHLDISEHFNLQRDLIEPAMEHFGKDIQSLSIDAALFRTEADAVQIIGRYCGPKLKRIQLENFRFQSNLDPLHTIFAKIEQLKLDRCSSSTGLVELMACCGDLISISLSNCLSKNNIFENTFPMLQQLNVVAFQIGEKFDNFITRHPSLIKLRIDNAQLSPRLVRTIGQHAKNLQELELVRVGCTNFQFHNDAKYIKQLSALKKLQLDCRNESIVPMLDALAAGKVPIESMKVQCDGQPDIAQAIDGIAQLKRIKFLQLTTSLRTSRLTDKHVTKLAKSLPELEELHLEEHNDWEKIIAHYEYRSQLSTIGLRKMLAHASKLKLLMLRSVDSVKIDVDDYKAILGVVQKRKENVPLVIEIYGHANQVDVPASVLDGNQNTLKIKFIINMF